jgi:hypothetical protein
MRRRDPAHGGSDGSDVADEAKRRSNRSPRAIFLMLLVGVLLLVAVRTINVVPPATTAGQGVFGPQVHGGSEASGAYRVPMPLPASQEHAESVSQPGVPVVATRRAARVGLLMLVVGSNFPAWWPFLTTSYARSYPTYQLIVVHTGAPPHGELPPHVRYVHLPLAELGQRFIDKLGVSRKRVDDKFASAKGLSDLKPFYGHIFDDLIPESTYTHWGWADWDLLIGDLPAVVSEVELWEHDALTFPGATLGFAWAGQLSILRNTNDARTLFRVVPNHVDLGFKVGLGEARQSGWEERILLRETLRQRPSMTILFHMAAQYDYKAQWLTWVPFDHFWHHGKIWRCARRPLTRPGRPPLEVQNTTRWLADVQQIQSDPAAFQARTDGRVCIRWDLESSPWRCCPHATGVTYLWRGGKLQPSLRPYGEAPAELRAALSSIALGAHAVTREKSYDVCQEGGFFHAGLLPRPSSAAKPACAKGTWALQDDIGRFSGALHLLQEECGTAVG